MKLLGIESSCDETGAAIIDVQSDGSITLLSNIVASSMNLHAQTGGIIPEIAAREQIKFILPVIKQALEKSNISVKDINALAVTIGPGLIGSLLVGVETVKTLSLLWNIPIIPVNHLFGHIYANFIESPKEIVFPALSLIVSGGHTDIVIMNDHKKITWIAGTRDDAAGEAFDKIGRLLGLSYPAGPVIENLAKEGNKKRFFFPRPLLDKSTFDFSFSGLKTAVLREVQKIEKEKGEIDNQTLKDLAFATQEAISDVLVIKTLKAAEKFSVKSILLGGGVAANSTLKIKFEHALKTKYNMLDIHLFVPKKQLCTDNAAMIATAGYFNQEFASWENIYANPELYFNA